jgi:hypothetical protein
MSRDGDEFRGAVRAHDGGLTASHYAGCVTLIEYLFDHHKRALTALAGALLQRGALDGVEVRAIVEAETVKAEAENGKARGDALAVTRGGPSTDWSM